MSEIQMSKRPEWMPEVMGLLVKDFYRTGLRAQIEVLEEISEYYGHTTRDMAQAKIAALRKELGDE